MAKKRSQELCAGVIIYRRKNGIELLLLKAKKGHWTLPKGHVHDGEELKDAAIRETLEETSIAISQLDLAPEFHEVVRRVQEFEQETVEKEIHLFLAQTLEEPKVSEEHAALAWINITKAEQWLQEHYVPAVKKAQEFLLLNA